LQVVQGDRALLGELAGVFREEYPKLLERAREAIDAGDAKSLQLAAHTLKGALGNFAAASAVEAAAALEAMARKRDLSGAPAAWQALHERLVRLAPAMQRLAGVTTQGLGIRG
jgi:HPt (histidine-containing phosphotransfer) domain-containing protein